MNNSKQDILNNLIKEPFKGHGRNRPVQQPEKHPGWEK